MSAPVATRPPGFLAAVLVVLTLLSGTSGAQEPDGPGEDSGEQPGGEEPPVTGAPADEVTVTGQSTWVGLGETYGLTLSPGQLPDDATLSVNARRALTTRNELHASYFGELPADRLTTLLDQPVGELPRDGDGNLDLTFEIDRATFGGNGSGGVHPVEIVAEGADGELLAHLVTYLLISPQTEFEESLPVGMVVEMGAPPAQQPDGEVVIDTTAENHLLERAELLTRLGGNPRVSAAPVPETLDSLVRSRGEESPTADEVLTGLGPHEVLARPYVDLDLDQWAEVPELITEVPREAEAGAVVIRNLLGREPAPNVWLTGPTVSPAEAATWAELDVPHAVLDPRAVAEIEAAPESVAPLVRAPGGPVGYISDEQLGIRLREATDPLTRHRLVTELAMLWFEQPGDPRPVALRVPAEGALDARQAAAALQEAEGTGVIDLLPVTELFARYGPADREPVPIELAPKDGSDSLAWMPAALEDARSTLSGIDGSVGRENAGLGRFERALLIAPGTDVSPGDRRTYLDSVDSTEEQLTEAVRMPDEFRITLTDRNAVIPLTITNDLDEAVTARVDLISPRLEFRDGDELEVELPPGSTRVDLRVRTRASGSFRLHIALTSPDGEVVLDRTTFDIRSTTISGVGLVLSIGAGAFLVLWWVRHWRRTRREQRREA